MSNPNGTSDSNAVSLYETSSGKKIELDVIDGKNFTAALKVTSHAVGIHLLANWIVGGSENCVDVNNEVTDLVVDATTFDIRGKYGLSAKTSTDITFIGHLAGRATVWEVNLGSWSDQSRKVQTQTYLKLTSYTYPIRVWIGNADIPVLDDPTKYVFLGFGRYGKFIRSVVMFFWTVGKKLKLA